MSLLGALAGLASGRGMPATARLRKSEGGQLPDDIAAELLRPTCRECGAVGAPRVSIRSHRTGRYSFLGCLDCAAGAIANRSDLAALVVGE